ncbi:hypothetical protein M2284_002643 [Rhodococcus sp. LBL1]|nr:hypothetical protein [Rhodococcus sp. LBL1]MDH6684027.1 hypothetical protein [Rhodococcus sp. LBL2]
MRSSAGVFICLTTVATIAGCSSESKSVESRVSEACIDTIRKEQAIGPNGPSLTSGYVNRIEANLLDMSFADVTARTAEVSGKTTIWMVEGTGTAQWEKRVKTAVWDDDGLPERLPEVTEKFSCEVGHRETDDAIVVFEYTTYHPTSGGSLGKVLVERDSAGR